MPFLSPSRRRRRSGPFAVASGLLRLIPPPRGHLLHWSDMGVIRRTLVVVGGFIIVVEVFGHLLGRLFDVLFFSFIVVAVIAFVGRLLYYRKWR